MRRGLLPLALAVSVVFNLGFVAAIAAPRFSTSGGTASCMPSPDPCASHLARMSATLKPELEPLRREQAEETHRLANLVTTHPPDRAAIELCLDQLASTTRSIHGLVVEALLDHQRTLPEGDRAAFSDTVRRRLCDPWVSCGFSACGSPTPQDQPSPPQGGEQ